MANSMVDSVVSYKAMLATEKSFIVILVKVLERVQCWLNGKSECRWLFSNSRQDVMCHFIISSQASSSYSLILNWLVFSLISTKGVVFININLFPIFMESLAATLLLTGWGSNCCAEMQTVTHWDGR